jgi:hypothetical protein
MTIVAMSIDQRRAKRKTTTLPGVLPGEGGPARLTTENGSETSGPTVYPAASMTANTIDQDDDD